MEPMDPGGIILFYIFLGIFGLLSLLLVALSIDAARQERKDNVKQRTSAKEVKRESGKTAAAAGEMISSPHCA